MKIPECRTIHSLLVEEKWNDAGNMILSALGSKPRTLTKAQSLTICRGLTQHLLDNDQYLEVATLQWGSDMFNTEPESSRRVFNAWHTKNKILLMGASSMSKTFSSGAWLVLDWMRDPLYTTVKLAAVSENHLNDNLFAHVRRLLNNCAIPLPYDIHFLDSDLWFGVRGAGYEFGFSGLAFKQSQETSGQFKGYKILPVRKIPHPKFGAMSRLRVLGDEGQNWPGGPFKDFNSLVASMGDDHLIKLGVAFNPEDQARTVVQMAEPDQGWLDEDLDRLYDYTSKQGYSVVRLDAAKSENVVQRKRVFHGLQTYEGYLSYLKAGGDNSANYYCVDWKTKALSKRGWLSYQEISQGDELYSLNPQTGLGEWNAAEGVHCENFNGNLVSMEGRGFSALITKDHRWAVTHKQRIESGGMGFSFKKTMDLKRHDLIPIARDGAGFVDESEFSDDFAELIGWVVTDGTFRPPKRGWKVCINQSETANPSKCQRIRELLARLNANHWEQIFNGIRFFNFSFDLAKRVRDVVTPRKILTFDFITKLTASGAERLYESLLLGDGSVQGGGTPYFASTSWENAEAFCALASMLGFASTTHRVWQDGGNLVKNGCWIFRVNVRKSKNTRPQYLGIEESEYSGIVWCPRTKNGTWLARRNGCCFFTGNCFARGFPPTKGAINTIIPPSWPNEARGEATFIENPVILGAVDLAFHGKDSAQMAVARWGLASSWISHTGQVEVFKDRLNIKNNKPRHVLQIDQILPLTKHDDSVRMAEEIIGRCKMLRITPEWLAVDKMQPVSEPVLTLSGWTEMGKIKTGDYVIGSDGKPTEVTGVYPQKDRRVMTVFMSDGSWTRCGPEHLWTVKNVRHNHPITITTSELKNEIESSNRKQRLWTIPLLSGPVEYPTQKSALPVDPYLLGCLLGDGNLRSNFVRFSSIDDEILESVASALPPGMRLVHSDRCNYALIYGKVNDKLTGRFTNSNPLVNEIRKLGLSGKLGHEKFIPEIYMRSSWEERLEILRGLMDTDGYVNHAKNRGSPCCGIRLANERLIMQIGEIVNSLGGIVRYSSHATRRYWKPGMRAYVATISLPDKIIPFRLKRKSDLMCDRIMPLRRFVDRIEHSEPEDSVCIRVASKDGLYVTRHHVITHNTGIGHGTYSHLNQVFGACLGISWNEGATEGKILSEDNEGADKQCDGVMSEMWWAFRRWMDPRCRAVLINPIIPPQPIQTQLTSRRYETNRKGIKVEAKEKYIARNQNSPDEVDALIQLVHLVRLSGSVLPGLLEESPKSKSSGTGDYKFQSVKDMVSVEDDDAMGVDGGSDTDHIDT